MFFKSEHIVKPIENVVKCTVIGGVTVQVIICFISSFVSIFNFLKRLRKRGDFIVRNEVTNIVSIGVASEKIGVI